MASSYETEDGQPRYGRRVSEEELATALAEQGIDPVQRSSGAREKVPVPAPSGPGRSVDPVPVTGWTAPPGGVSLERWSARPGRRPVRGRQAGQQAPGRWRLLVVGLVLMLVVPFALVAAAFRLSVDWGGADVTVLSESGTVYLDKGVRAMVYAGSRESTTDCTVADPKGVVVTKHKVDAHIPYTGFTASASGTYTIRCGGSTEGMIVGPPVRADRLMVASLMTLGAFPCGVAGLAVTVLGLSRALRRRR